MSLASGKRRRRASCFCAHSATISCSRPNRRWRLTRDFWKPTRTAIRTRYGRGGSAATAFKRKWKTKSRDSDGGEGGGESPSGSSVRGSDFVRDSGVAGGRRSGAAGALRQG